MNDWFEKITGFRELPYEETQARLRVEAGRLHSAASDRHFAVGELEVPTLAELRSRAGSLRRKSGRTKVTCVEGDARRLHADSVNRRAVFQVASQFNLLEMVGPSITPEHGVTRYMHDPTQGPACAMAAGAGTIYRNYLVDIDGHQGQRADRQIDCLADLGLAFGNREQSHWAMRNGYALCTAEGLANIDRVLEASSSEEIDRLRGLLRIGLHWNVEVTDVENAAQLVSQAYCSALPVAYTRVPPQRWQRFACLVLEASYEATLLAAVLNAARGCSDKVLLTRVGGGAFGNDLQWINAAILRAVRLVQDQALDVRIVCYGSVPRDVRELVAEANR